MSEYNIHGFICCESAWWHENEGVYQPTHIVKLHTHWTANRAHVNSAFVSFDELSQDQSKRVLKMFRISTAAM